MEQIIINKASGAEIRLFNRVDTAEQVKEFMGQDAVNIAFRSAVPVSFDVGDYVEVFGERYTLNLLPTEKKEDDRNFTYNVRFEGIQYDFIKVQTLDIDAAGISTGTAFSLMGNLEDFCSLIIRNMERVFGPGRFELGTVQAGTETMLLSFNNQTNLQTLQQVCEAYDTNFYLERTGVLTYKLHVKKVEDILPDTFRYGRTKGLYKLERTNVNSSNIVTRLFAYGGTTNILPSYRSRSLRLKMPLAVIFSEGQPYITDAGAVSQYGNVEGSVTFDEIYPKRIGSISDIDPNSELSFMDSGMPFDLNAQLAPGLTAKINFKTGNLAGYTFEVTGYDNTAKKFTINTYTDDRGMVFPSATSTTFQVQPGDQYVLTDIIMPQSYIDEAEEQLYLKAIEQLSILSVPAVKWELDIESNYLKSKETVPGQIIHYFQVGYYINVQDTDLKIDGKSQITGFTREILNPYVYNLTISEQFVKRRNIRARALRENTFRGYIFSWETLNSRQIANAGTVSNMVLQSINTTLPSSQRPIWGLKEW